MKYLILVLIFLLLYVISFADDLVNYENSSIYSTTGGYFREYQDDQADFEIDSSNGMGGTSKACKVTTLENNFHIWWIQNDTSKVLIPEADGSDRLSFYLKIPSNYPQSADYNLHIGTYTRDPEAGDYVDGTHFYHLFNIPGSEYPTKLIANQHPQHLSGVSGTDPGDNPRDWDYFDGFTRFYVSLEPWDDPPISVPYDSYIDEVSFYSVSEPENDVTINSISCTYMGSGRYIIGWHGSSQYETGNCDDHNFEVRYSTTPITNSNYSSATVVTGGPWTLVEGNGVYNYFFADFTIAENNHYYFAIKDITEGFDTYVSKIDYISYLSTAVRVDGLKTIRGGTLP